MHIRHREPQIRSSRPELSEDSGLAQVLHPYGVGIDTHSKFIQVCCIWTEPGPDHTNIVKRSEKEFSTEWPQLLQAHTWAYSTLSKVQPQIKNLSKDSFRYCIESTGTYHMPVLLAWRGVPCVVNPLLAGATRRKTDVLDARLLANHSITGLWKPSFIPSQQAQELRVIWAMRAEALHRATRASNQINNIMLRFGHTFGRSAPMRSAAGEGIVSDLLDGRVPQIAEVCPDGLPLSVRPRIAGLLADLNTNIQRTKRAVIDATNYVKARDWPIGSGTMPGTNLLTILMSVPGVGEATALTWLSEVCDPSRFQDARQVAAYCGCDPSLKVSAGKVTSQTRRQGNARVHQALLYAASGVLRRPAEPLGQWGRSIAGRHKKGGYRKACGAIARRIAAALWHVHRKGETFSYDQYNLSTDLILPNDKLSSFLSPRAVKTLAAESITTTKHLAAAYSSGKLATIYGLGASSISDIKLWIQKHGRGKPLGARRNALAVGAARAKREAPSSSQVSSTKEYRLDPSLTFKPKRHNQKTNKPADEKAARN